MEEESRKDENKVHKRSKSKGKKVKKKQKERKEQVLKEIKTYKKKKKSLKKKNLEDQQSTPCSHEVLDVAKAIAPIKAQPRTPELEHREVSVLPSTPTPRRQSVTAREPFQLIENGEDAPGKRYGHSTILDEGGGGVMIVFGGCNEKAQFEQDLFYFNIENNTWSQFTGSGAPHGRHFHSAVLYEGSMYIFGGTSNGFYNDMYQFHLDTQTWSIVKPNNSPPSPRYGHTAVIYEDSMYVFGGYDKDTFVSNDLYQFNFNTLAWKKVKTKGRYPKDRYHHSAVVYQGSMYIFGGFKCFNELMEYRFATETWSLVNARGTLPRPRWGHKAVVHKGKMYMFGGQDLIKTFDDLYEFCFETSTWRKSHSEGISPLCHHSLVLHDEKLYIFGGRNIYNFIFNELYEYNLENEQEGPANTIREDMRRLLKEGLFCDVTFKFPLEGEDVEIKAHRNILSARCEPLGAMLRSGMRESNCGVVVVGDGTSHRTFYAMVEYLYTGCIHVTPQDLVDLLRCANQYQLDHLKSLCEKKLIRYVDRDNVLNMLLLADHLAAPELRAYSLHFIAKQPHILHLHVKNADDDDDDDDDYEEEHNHPSLAPLLAEIDDYRKALML